LSPRIVLPRAWVQASHRFVLAVSHRSVIFLGDRVRAAPGSGRQL